jgi:hypothetical protein
MRPIPRYFWLFFDFYPIGDYFISIFVLYIGRLPDKMGEKTNKLDASRNSVTSTNCLIASTSSHF